MFQQHFVEAMAIPHKTAPYPHLRKAVTLPPPKDVTARVATMAAAGGAGAAEAPAYRAADLSAVSPAEWNFSFSVPLRAKAGRADGSFRCSMWQIRDRSSGQVCDPFDT